MSITIVLYLLACVCFVLATLNMPGLNWMCAGFALLTLSLFVK